MSYLKEQRIRRGKEEILKQLESFKIIPRFSAGVWYFFPPGGRFHERYIPPGSIEDVLSKVRFLYDKGFLEKSFRLEAHYPNEVNEENIDTYRELERETGIRLLTIIPNLFYDKEWEFGSLSNPYEEIRRRAIDRTIKALRLNKEVGTEFAVLWPGIDGYENPFAMDFYGMWDRFEKGLAEAMDEVPGVRVALEPKPYEPRGNNIYRNTANGILAARNIEALLKSPLNRRLLSDGEVLVGLNPEVGHVLMGHEELAYAFASILRDGRLMHTHWNSQPLGNYDQDLNVGVLGIDQTYAALMTLKMYGYRGYFGIDINPERMPVERALILNINALRAACARLNNLDYGPIVEAMFDPAGNRGIIEDILTRALAPEGIPLLDIKAL
jgi:xylose isomerase